MFDIDKITFIEPDSCKQCRWIPPKSNNEDQVIAIKNSWLHARLLYCVMCLYICPKCGAVWANKNAVENVEKLDKAKDSNIIKPDLD